MASTSTFIDETVRDYVRTASLRRESPVLARLRERTAALPESRMQIAVEQGRLMALLVGVMGVRRAIEVGTFTGYSALCVAEQLPPDGRLVACDVSAEWTAIARAAWREAGVDDRIDLRLGPAAGTLAAMLEAGEAGHYDFAFIDADKDGYAGYYEQCLSLLRPGGLVAIDNLFMGGRALAERPADAAPAAVRALADRIREDARVEPVVLAIGDGLLLARKHAGA